MTSGAWPALDTVLAALSTAPSRTGSVIATVYGDAILPRGGSLSLGDLLALMRRLGASDGVVRTAVSRLAKDGLLQGRRAGRRSAYALTSRGMAEFQAAIPAIYGPLAGPWDGRLHLAFPEPGADRGALDDAGYAVLAPGILVSANPPPSGMPALAADGPAATLHMLANRAWPLARLREMYEDFLQLFAPLAPTPADPGRSALDAMAARIVLVHAWRRIALRDPHLPAGMLPADWPGFIARASFVTLYRSLAVASERWLDAASDGAAPLPPGPPAAARFAGQTDGLPG